MCVIMSFGPYQGILSIVHIPKFLRIHRSNVLKDEMIDKSGLVQTENNVYLGMWSLYKMNEYYHFQLDNGSS
jgi:hypothetical protein